MPKQLTPENKAKRIESVSHLKNFLSGQFQRFQNDREVEMSVTRWFQSQEADFYDSGIEQMRGLQPAARGPPAGLGRVLFGPGRVFHKIQCVMNIED